jgi:hypothetical protein
MELWQWGVTLFIVGFVINLAVAIWRQYNPPAGSAAGPPSIPEAIQEAIQRVFLAVADALSPTSSIPDKIQAFGSAIAWLGIALFLVWVWTTVNGTGNKNPTPSGSPAAS